MTYHVISLVIIFNNILPSSPIALTYHLVSDGLLIQYTSPLSYCSFEILLTSISFIRTQPFLFKSPQKVLQLTKAYKVEAA